MCDDSECFDLNQSRDEGTAAKDMVTSETEGRAIHIHEFLARQLFA